MDKQEPEQPAYIDYESNADLEPERWTANNLESYWRSTQVKKRRIGVVGWPLRSKSLAKRLLEEFEPEDLLLMINYWIETEPLDRVPMFELFYAERYKMYEKAKPKDYSEWEM